MPTTQDYQELATQIAAHHRKRMDSIFAGRQDPGRFRIPEWAATTRETHVPPPERNDYKRVVLGYGDDHSDCANQRRDCLNAVITKLKNGDIDASEATKENSACNDKQKQCEAAKDDDFTNKTNEAIEDNRDDQDAMASIIAAQNKALNFAYDLAAKIVEYLKNWIEKAVSEVVDWFKNTVGGFMNDIKGIF
ncbi:hypothetical protein [Nocardia amikacinitolerans]|uniref:hypothetical protein n=1 Tax=Nocardia amikacinitolerans TaxID=756689 RepID=UPI0020A2F9D9|nr:hypothetical protein [Nocardia amikacinitolerans]MCP2276301.1 hypothetical protein [Nocardia amikacinitolerans]